MQALCSVLEQKGDVAGDDSNACEEAKLIAEGARCAVEEAKRSAEERNLSTRMRQHFGEITVPPRVTLRAAGAC